MHWIDQFVTSTFNLYAGQVIEGFQPLDFFHFYPLYYDCWMKRVAEVLEQLGVEHKSYEQLKELLPIPSSMRAWLQKIIPSYKGVRTNTKDFKTVSEFFARMLQECCPEDPFAITRNPFHTNKEINALMALDWCNGDKLQARHIGQLITSLGSLGHGLYNDLGIDFVWDAYGPYTVTYNNQPHTLMIRHFTNLTPQGLWDAKYTLSVNDVKIYALYQDVDWIVPYVGCHASPRSGSIVDGLRQSFITADGSTIDDGGLMSLIQESAQKAEALYREIRSMSFEETKAKVLVQECYQLKTFFDAAHMDWRPTQEMIERVKDKPLLEEIIPHGVLMTNMEEYKESFGLTLFAKEVLGQDLA